MGRRDDWALKHILRRASKKECILTDALISVLCDSKQRNYLNQAIVWTSYM